MISSCTKLFNCIIYYSQTNNNIWHQSPKFDQKVKDRALKLGKKCFSKLGKTGKKFRYSGVKNVHDIRTDDKRCYKLCSCNCSGFVKWALCPHIVAYSNTFQLDKFGKENRQATASVAKIKRMPKTKTKSYWSFQIGVISIKL